MSLSPYTSSVVDSLKRAARLRLRTHYLLHTPAFSPAYTHTRTDRLGPTIKTHMNNDVNEDGKRRKCGEYVGQVKWFQDKKGWGYLTVVTGDEKGQDVFVHHTGIVPIIDTYRTLHKGEYVQFDKSVRRGGGGGGGGADGDDGISMNQDAPCMYHATNVTGIAGGPLMCDVKATHKAGAFT